MQFNGTLADQLREVLKIIASGNAEASDKVLSSSFQVTVGVVPSREIVFRSAKVRVAGDRGGTVELAQTFLGLRLSGRVEAVTSEELVGRDSLLTTEARLRLLEFLLCNQISTPKL